MPAEPTHPWTMHVPRLQRGQRWRAWLGRLELVLEATRSGCSLLLLEGKESRTWTLALPAAGELRLECRAPRWPLCIALADPLLLAPGARVRGYVRVPLVPTLCWLPAAGAALSLVEALPAELGAAWDEGNGTCVQRCTSPLLERPPAEAAWPFAVAPWSIRNDSARLQSPEALEMRLLDRELRRCGGHLLAAPRRLRLRDQGPAVPSVRTRAEAPGR
jgi:hypothetical protein